jgi:hypothetical protein
MGTVGSVRVSGWPAVAMAAVVFFFPIWSVMHHLQPVGRDERDAVRAWLVEDYTQPDAPHHLAGLGATSAEGNVVLQVPPASAAAADTARVTIGSIDAHGWKDSAIARATLTAQLPDESPVHAERYLSVRQSRDGAWRVVRESDAAHYWWVLVPGPRNGSSWP